MTSTRIVYAADFGDEYGLDPARIVETGRLWHYSMATPGAPVVSPRLRERLHPGNQDPNPNTVGHLAVGRDLYGPQPARYLLEGDVRELVSALAALELPQLPEKSGKAARYVAEWRGALARQGLSLGVLHSTHHLHGPWPQSV